MKYLVTFMATGGLTVEANSPDEAQEIFDTTMQEKAAAEILANGIDITEIQLDEEEDFD